VGVKRDGQALMAADASGGQQAAWPTPKATKRLRIELTAVVGFENVGKCLIIFLSILLYEEDRTDLLFVV
jgi:hypothetical protein